MFKFNAKKMRVVFLLLVGIACVVSVTEEDCSTGNSDNVWFAGNLGSICIKSTNSFYRMDICDKWTLWQTFSWTVINTGDLDYLCDHVVDCAAFISQAEDTLCRTISKDIGKTPGLSRPVHTFKSKIHSFCSVVLF